MTRTPSRLRLTFFRMHNINNSTLTCNLSRYIDGKTGGQERAAPTAEEVVELSSWPPLPSGVADHVAGIETELIDVSDETQWVPSEESAMSFGTKIDAPGKPTPPLTRSLWTTKR